VTGERGTFVVLEGGDGVGKSTQLDLLCAWLEARGERVVRTFEPGDTAIGRQIRRLVLDPTTGELSRRAEALLYAADKAQHVDAVVRPALAQGAIVICDRYVDSMIAYQGAGRVLSPAEVEQVARWATEDLLPDLTVVLDVAPDQAVGAITDKDRLEAAGDVFHGRVREHFLALARREPDRYLVVDARRPRADIAAEIQMRVIEFLSARRATALEKRST
jgi:dTMP kinase